MNDSESERLRLIWDRTLVALRAVVREFAITEDELHSAGDYFNRLGRSGMFPSLLDVGLAMTSVGATKQAIGTRRNLEGPFYRKGAPIRPNGDLLEHPPADHSTILRLSGRVTDAASGRCVPEAELDVWQADENGIYDQEGFHLRGRIVTDTFGRYAIRTVVPHDYSQHDEDPIGELFRKLGRHNYRAAHIHMKIWVGGKEVLTTQLFMPDSPHIDSDYVVGAVSQDLIVSPISTIGSEGRRELHVDFDFAVALTPNG